MSGARTSQAFREAEHSRAVREMFGGIASRYDLLNHVLSLNIDKGWRRAVAKELRPILDDPQASVLDVACGTGDLALELASTAKASITGTDFCRPMLQFAKEKIEAAERGIPLIEADAMELPFPDNSFNSATIAFGLRNLPNVENGLVELFRVLKPNGKLVVLEFSQPVIPGVREAFNFYFTRILPRIGGFVSGSRCAYEYLPDSVRGFPPQKELAAMMEAKGFSRVRFKNLTGGIAAIHVGEKL
ncbi:MAG: ubiquinone/menaquinone biosynthesis methyltransferase [Acidobacteria bacterium OLB17]|nr:MAG: ubiquinone/menaquinone biosynthesis methyltransferase [Acidobacteria bacterium OLB17]MCZ2389504.1 bifunctional demethylmenaquinone methyltransferase/2-methoxy-6-polyprenyl-1,4-benzoquinol methylase UbiE [Acidobacteriota bacterium]